ncbi:granulins [Austrofundulus limnaeus]|uniref:Granulins n=1 Tax=Austrofundulus limnaeus TaxID=52670 RepID=A0A2I4CDV7_AUSLI|nr:PREDICTED: granulins-like [Austrofundulus limnaeus]
MKMKSWAVICWTLLVLVLVLVGADECPDGGRCKEGQTCCRGSADSFSCCPFHQAECCEDHVHCCPADTTCDSSTSSCVNSSVSVPWAERTSADRPSTSKSFRMIRTSTDEDSENTCPDLSRCPAEFSCLKASTKFGCCPVAKGVSCADGKHCCPEGHRCSIDSRSCIKKEFEMTVLCNDGVSECPNDMTCCETPDGKWGCCPLPKAVCCDDKKHCCPEGTTCDTENMKCISSSTQKEFPMWSKFPARQRADWENQKVKEVACNETAACPDGSTCCKNKHGDWSCCHLKDAICCKDLEHCCPKGTRCNKAKGTCDDRSGSVPWTEKVSTVRRKNVQMEVKVVPCDDKVGCPDGTTCCKTQQGSWACCPLPEAVCCQDFIHCCPKGQTCNLAAQTCDGGQQSVPWVKKISSIPRKDVQTEVKVVPCDDKVGCPDGTTCCKTKEGSWACCPLPEAVCCQDFIHCCPKGQTCNLAAQTCEGGQQSVPWVKKISSIPRKDVQMEVKVVPCDDKVGCPDGTTCCKTKEGSWACCPLPEAVCCQDFIHCCPKGQTCNLAAQTCEGGQQSVPWVKKISSIPRKDVQMEVKVVPCDDKVGCPDGTTCCKTKEGSWACCPLPEAVCCQDFIHCCPKGQTCNLAAQTCDGGQQSVPWVKKISSIPRKDVQTEVKVVPCDDKVGCPDGTTCCKTQQGSWGCCPLPQAVCCSDRIHCCPHGSSCTGQGSCIRNSKLNWSNWNWVLGNKKKTQIL